MCEGWIAVSCQRDAVKLWPQFSAPTPLVWESWTWVPMICRIQEWSGSLLDWRVHTVDWKLSGQFNSMVKQLHHTFNIRGHWTDSYTSIKVNMYEYIIFIGITTHLYLCCHDSIWATLCRDNVQLAGHYLKLTLSWWRTLNLQSSINWHKI